MPITDISKPVRSNNTSPMVVTAALKKLHKNAAVSPSPNPPEKKKWRRSQSSVVLRVPKDLVPQLKGIIADHKEQAANDPDKW